MLGAAEPFGTIKMNALGKRAALLALLFAFAAPALAQNNRNTPPPPAGGGILTLLPPTTASRHQIAIAGKQIAYIAEAGTVAIRDGNGTITAEVFYTAYFQENPAPRRPIAFVSNGGPGAASAFLNLGAIGPKALTMTASGEIAPPPAELLDNPDCWLDFSDLVFVDPVGTGYSRAADPNAESQFWGVRRDTDTMAAFIRLYLQQSGRMLSPLFLVGESYGGFRAAMLARTLQADTGIAPSGLVLISPALEMSLLRASDYDPLPWALTLPALAAANLELQGVTGRAALAERLKEVERYALSDYLTALAAPLPTGGRLASGQVSRFTGLPLELVERNFGRVSASLFMKEREQAGGQVLSRYDGAVASPDLNPGSGSIRGPDAVLDRGVPAWTSAFVAHVREDLGFRTEITYRLLNHDISGRWDYGGGGSRQGFAGALDDLAEARARNPRLQVLIAQGYSDLATPYPTGAFLVGQMPPLPGAAPITIETYEGGHMMYMRPQSRAALKGDAAALFKRAVPAQGG